MSRWRRETGQWRRSEGQSAQRTTQSAKRKAQIDHRAADSHLRFAVCDLRFFRGLNMSVQFKGEELFGDGPQRSVVGPLGEYVLQYAVVNPYQAGSAPMGPLELTITVTGRLIAESEE